MTEQSDSVKSKMTPNMAMDALLAQLGRPGRFQVFLFILMGLNYTPIAFNHLIMAFIGSTPTHTCHSPAIENSRNSTLLPNLTAYGKCETQYYWQGPEDTNFSTTFKCSNEADTRWRYKTSSESETTIVTEWDLVCDNKYQAPLATTIYFVGVMVGGPIFGHLADIFGRKPILIVCMLTPAAIGVGVAFVQTYVQFVILRFIMGSFFQGLQVCVYPLVFEHVNVYYRGYFGPGMSLIWGVNVCLIALVTYFLRQWRYVQLAISAAGLLGVVYICLVPESMRWLFVTGKVQKAEARVRKIAEFNKLPFPQDAWDTLVQAQNQATDKAPKHSVIDLLRTPQIRKRTLLLCYLWFIMSVGYYGLSLNITALHGDKYLNFFINGGFEIVAYIISVFANVRIGRKKTMIAFLILGSTCCIAAGIVPLVPTDPGFEKGKLSTGLAILGRTGASGVFASAFLFTSELFPTVVRIIGIGACTFWTRIGGIVAPQILLLGDVTNRSVPIILFGCMALGGAIAVIFLPETAGCRLPDSIADVETNSGNNAEISDNDGDKEKKVARDATQAEVAVVPGSGKETQPITTDDIHLDGATSTHM